MNRFFILTFISLLCTVAGTAQSIVKTITHADGLSNNSVNCIAEDSRHALWIGTWDGLNVYDGRSMRKYMYSRRPTSLSNNIVRQVVEQNDSVVWVSTDRGVNRWSRLTDTFVRHYPGMESHQQSNSNTFTLLKTRTGSMLCCVNDVALFYYDERLATFRPTNGQPPSSVKRICIGNDNLLYVLDREGRLRSYLIDERQPRPRLMAKGVLSWDGPVKDIYYVGGHLFVKDGQGLYIAKSWSNWQRLEAVDGQVVKAVACDDAYAYLGLQQGGCLRYRLTDGTCTSLLPDGKDASVFSLYKGSQDILWIGTDGRGLLQLYHYASMFGGIATPSPVRCFCENEDGTLLVGTKGSGISLFDPATRTLNSLFTTANGLNSNAVYAMRRNRQGDLFIGTDGNGLCYLPKGSRTLKRITAPAGHAPIQSIYSICFTHNDSVAWLGSYGGGLMRLGLRKEGNDYRLTSVRQYLKATSGTVNNDVVFCMLEGNKPGELLLGTRGGGVNTIDTRTERFGMMENGDTPLTHDDILYMMRSRKGTLWIGTGYGLNAIDKGRHTEYTDAQGLPSNTIHAMAEDAQGRLWISTNKGICMLDPQSGHTVCYTPQMGLQNDEFCDGAAYTGSDGTLYFGGVEGFNYFDARHIRQRSHKASLSLSSIDINEKATSPGLRIHDGTLRLAYDEQYVRLNFMVYDFINNEDCEVRYRIRGYADEWIGNGSSTHILLTKLPPGHYTLEVACTNSDRIWSDQLYTLQLHVARPWWRSLWAYAVYLLLLMAAACGAGSMVRHRMRLNRQLLLEQVEKENQRRINEQKLNFFTNVAHEFFTPLTLIYGPAQHLLEHANIDSYAKRYIYTIKRNADRLQKLMTELMEFRKAESGHTAVHPQHVDLQLLTAYVTDNYTELAEERHIDFRFENSEPQHFVTDAPALEKIVLNLVSNAFKYTPDGGYIHASIGRADGGKSLRLWVRNSGKGLSEEQRQEMFGRFSILENTRMKHSRSTGIGLSLTKSLAELLGGTISVDSQPGEFVEFTVVLPELQTADIQETEGSREQEETTLAAMPTTERKDVHILLVEDEKEIRLLLRDILEPYYTVSEADDGEKAIAMIEQERPQVIISDIMMPRMDGIAMADRLKENPMTAAIPIIHISAKSSVEDHVNAYRHGTDLFIPKPFHPQQVLSAVENIICRYAQMERYFNSPMPSMTVKEGISMSREEEQLLNRIVKYIEDNIDDENLSPDSIAEVIGMSRAGLYRKFKDLTGKTPSEFIKNIRLKHSAHLIRTTTLTVTEIMYRTGFASKSYFYKEFSKAFQCSPTEYRQQGKP